MVASREAEKLFLSKKKFCIHIILKILNKVTNIENFEIIQPVGTCSLNTWLLTSNNIISKDGLIAP